MVAIKEKVFNFLIKNEKNIESFFRYFAVSVVFYALIKKDLLFFLMSTLIASMYFTNEIKAILKKTKVTFYWEKYRMKRLIKPTFIIVFTIFAIFLGWKFTSSMVEYENSVRLEELKYNESWQCYQWNATVTNIGKETTVKHYPFTRDELSLIYNQCISKKENGEDVQCSYSFHNEKHMYQESTDRITTQIVFAENETQCIKWAYVRVANEI